jgi:hypothetical protein
MFILIRTGSWSTSLMEGSPALLIRSMAIKTKIPSRKHPAADCGIIKLVSSW